MRIAGIRLQRRRRARRVEATWDSAHSPTAATRLSMTFLMVLARSRAVGRTATASLRIPGLRSFWARSVASKPELPRSDVGLQAGLGAERASAKLAPVARGLAIERALGGNLPRSFPVIDRFDRGVATSIKSIDLTAKTYQNSGALSRRLGGYVDKVAAFRGKDFGGVGIEASDITGRVLVVAVPAGAATAGQERALKALVGYGVSRGVHVRIVSVR